MAKSRKRSGPDTSTSSTADEAAQSFTSPPAPPERQDDRRAVESSRQRIEQRAYELYLSRGGGHGSDWEDWLAAERELVANSANDDRSKP